MLHDFWWTLKMDQNDSMFFLSIVICQYALWDMDSREDSWVWLVQKGSQWSSMNYRERMV